MSTSAILIIGGLVCLALCGLLFYKVLPQDGKPESAWTGTDTRGTAVAMALLLLLLTGLGMLAKGLF